MGKGEIVSEYGEGRYVIKILYDRESYDTQVAWLTAKSAELATTISGLETQLAGDPDNLELARDLKIAKLKKLSADKRIEYLEANAPPESSNQDAWCIDYTEGLTGEVATVESPKNGIADAVNIAAGYADSATWAQATDGLLTHSATMTAAQLFYNLAMKPGWQKWMPIYRWGTITAIDRTGNTADVTLDAAAATRPTSEIQGTDVNQVSTLSAVPIEYMSCDQAAFKVGDQVVVEFRNVVAGSGYGSPYVIGFQDNPQPCSIPSAARVTEVYSASGYYTGNLELWMNATKCTFDDAGGAEQIHIGSYLRTYYSDVEGIWSLVDYRFAQDNVTELVIVVERFFTAARNLPTVPNFIYKAGIDDLYTAIVFRIDSDYTASIRDIYTVDYGTRKCPGGCTARYPDEEPDYESERDCPGWSNACGKADGCCSSYTAESDDSGTSSASYAWGDVTTDAASDCNKTCNRSCSSTTCCYNCVDGVDIQKTYLLYGQEPRLYGVKGTTTHATSRETSSSTVINNTRETDESTTNYTSCRDTEWAGLWPDPRTQNTVRTVTSGVLAETIEHEGQPDDPNVYGDQSCTACCALQKVREYDTDVSAYTYSAGFGFADYCDPLYNACQCPKEAYSETITAEDEDTGWVWEQYASQHVCFDKTLQSASRLVYGNAADFGCATYKDIAAYKEKTLGAFEYASGVSCYDCTEASWHEMCDCDLDSYEPATCCTASFGDAGSWGWGAGFALYEVLDEDVYVDSSYEWETDFAGAYVQNDQGDPTLNGSGEDGWTFDASNAVVNLEDFSPIQSLPQDSDEGMCFVARHSQYVGGNKFASFTTAFNETGTLERVRCCNSAWCYEAPGVSGHDTLWSVLMHRNGGGAIVYKQADDLYYGSWVVFVFANLPKYTPTADDLADWAVAGTRYVWASPLRASFLLTVQSSSQSYRQTFRMGVAQMTRA